VRPSVYAYLEKGASPAEEEAVGNVLAQHGFEPTVNAGYIRFSAEELQWVLILEFGIPMGA
jgi:hypothetical protein